MTTPLYAEPNGVREALLSYGLQACIRSCPESSTLVVVQPESLLPELLLEDAAFLVLTLPE